MTHLRTIYVSVALAFFLLPALTTAADADSISITLEDAQRIALEKNPQLQSAQKEIQQSAAQVKQARGNLLPSLSAFANYNHSFELPVITIEFPDPVTGQTQKTELAMGTKENITSGLRLQQPLFMGGAVYSGYQIAQKGKVLAGNQAKITRQQILLQVRQAFYNALFTKELIAVAEEAVANVQRNLEQVQKQHDVGAASGFDLLRAQVQVSNTKPQLITAKHRHEQAITGLRTVIGLDKNANIRVVGSLEYEKTALVDKDLADLQQRALQERIEMQNIRIQRSMQRENLDIARSKYMPTLAMSASVQHQMQEDEFGLNRQDFVRSISGGLSLSVPLFAGGSNHAGVQQAKVELRKMDDTEQQVRNMINAEVESAYYSLLNAQEKLESQNKTIDQAEESLRLADLMYAEGTTTQLDVLNAQLALQQARSNYSQYLLQYNVARDQLKKAINAMDINNE